MARGISIPKIVQDPQMKDTLQILRDGAMQDSVPPNMVEERACVTTLDPSLLYVDTGALCGLQRPPACTAWKRGRELVSIYSKADPLVFCTWRR